MTDPALYIITAAIIGMLLGWFGKHLASARSIRRTSTEAWNQARIFYTRRHNL